MEKKTPIGSEGEMEAAGSLTPELNGAGRSHAHPFRYMGQEPNGSLAGSAGPTQGE